MTIQGWWTKEGRPFFAAEVTLRGGFSRYVELQADTACTNTIISEVEFPKGKLESLGFPAGQVVTLVGMMPAFVIPECRLTLFDVRGNHRTIQDITLWFVRETKTTKLRRALGRSFSKLPLGQTRAPRNLLGQDVLNRFWFLARHPRVLLLADTKNQLAGHI